MKSNGVKDTTKAAATDVARDAIEAAVREAKSIGLGAEDIRSLTNAAIDRWFREAQ